jgi:hypothetical protein
MRLDGHNQLLLKAMENISVVLPEALSLIGKEIMVVSIMFAS